MDLLQRNHQLLLKGINCTFLRYLHARIEWEDRLIGIFGSRGVGKTTLLLQHIKLKFEDSREALYVNLDDFWFETHSLTDAVKEFLQAGGHYLFFGLDGRGLSFIGCQPRLKDCFRYHFFVLADRGAERVKA